MADQIAQVEARIAPVSQPYLAHFSPVSRPHLARISPISRKVEALIAAATDLASLQRYEDALRTGETWGDVGRYGEM